MPKIDLTREVDGHFARSALKVLIPLAVVAGAAGVVRRVYFPTLAVDVYPSCVSNIKQIGLCCLMYGLDYDDTMPPAAAWMDSISPYMKGETTFHDVEGVGPGEYGYAFRTKASRMQSKAISDASKFPLLFDSTQLSRNATSEFETMPSPGRHKGKNSVAYLDGHVKSLRAP